MRWKSIREKKGKEERRGERILKGRGQVRRVQAMKAKKRRRKEKERDQGNEGAE